MRAMGGARREVDEKRLVRPGGFLLAAPADRLLGHRLTKVPRRILMWRLDRRGVLVERRVPLARLPALEPVPVVEPLAYRPAIEGAGETELVVGCVVPLAESRRAVIVFA